MACPVPWAAERGRTPDADEEMGRRSTQMNADKGTAKGKVKKKISDSDEKVRERE